FVCHGNICRSPMAEFILKDMVEKSGLADEFYIESAATSSEEIWNGVGNPIYPPARRILDAHGISCDGKRARQVTKADYNRFDYIILMDRSNMRNIRRIIPADPAGKMSLMMDYTDHPRDVADPWYSGDFQQTWDDITEGCEGFLKSLYV
ncbi:MAG: low molecular weight phosphotyrosine protein phosphatase, partial [Parasporobacterium sp.]|nr:low molecular weight phosphotyrosine protein phosphatase [Parasporobacterium sp.]